MDLAKFISIMSNKSLYFTSFSKFDDPYECYLPEVYNKPINTLIENNSQKIYEKAKTIIKKFENEYPEKYLDAMKNISSIYESSLFNRWPWFRRAQRQLVGLASLLKKEGYDVLVVYYHGDHFFDTTHKLPLLHSNQAPINGFFTFRDKIVITF